MNLEEKNISSEDALNFLIEHYRENKNVTTHSKDWSMVKKYKNINNETCRDFTYIGKSKLVGLECVVIYDAVQDQMTLVEGVSYPFFARQSPNWIVFDYFVVKKDLQFQFYFKNRKNFHLSEEEQNNFLSERFNDLFRFYKRIETDDKNIHGFLITFKNIADPIEILERDRFKLNNKLYNSMSSDFQNQYELAKFDVNYFYYNSKPFESFTYQQAIDKVLNITSTNKNIDKRDLGLIRKLLLTAPAFEVEILEKIIDGFEIKQKEKIREIFKNKINNVMDGSEFLLDSRDSYES